MAAQPGSARGDLEGIHYLRTIEDCEGIKQAAAQAHSAVVVGAGFIGMEVAASLTLKGLTVTVVYPQKELWPQLASRELSQFFQHYYEDRHVRLLAQDHVTKISGRPGAFLVDTKKAGQLRADLVVVGVGVEAQTSLLKNAGLAAESEVEVNEFLQTPDPNIFAAGDIANYPDIIFNRRRRVEHWDNAQAQGQCAGRNMAGKKEPFKHLPYFFSDIFDLSWEFIGETDGVSETLGRGSLRERSYLLWYLRENRVVGAWLMGRPEEEKAAAEKLMTEHTDIRALRQKLGDPDAKLA